ncbi:MAG: inositol monophosphatase family protein [Dongiaceae bacterium]
MATRSAIINVMARAADKAARGLRRDFGEVEQLQVSMKGPGDFVSTADLKAERTLREELNKARPGFAFLMEESGATPGSDPSHRWLVDPLDGTTNFLHGIPHFAISIGLEREGELIAGVVYDPIKEELFWAERGMGAYLNDRRLRVSSRRKLDQALLATGMPARHGVEAGARGVFVAQVDAALAATAGVRRLGSAALDLAYVAAGRYEGFWENHLSAWDIAAGIVLVREAGGYVSDLDGRDDLLTTGNTLAANDHLHKSIGRLLRSAAKLAAAARKSSTAP